MDIFEKPSVLIIHEGSLDQEVFPRVGCRGPQMEFFVTVDSKNCIDLYRRCLSFEMTLKKPSGTGRFDGSENITFANNTLHSIFSHLPNLCTMETLTALNAEDVKDLEQNAPTVTIEKAFLFVNKIVV